MNILVVMEHGEQRCIELDDDAAMTMREGAQLNCLRNGRVEHFFTKQGYYDGWGECLEPPAAETRWQPILVDRDADLLRELRVYLDTQVITGDTIGDLRRSLFMPWDSMWNGWVREETAKRELPSPHEADQ